MAGTHITINSGEIDRLQTDVRVLADGVRGTSAFIPHQG